MKKFKKTSSAGLPIFWVVLVGILILGAAQLVRAATGGVPGQPGVKYDATQASDSITSTSESYVDMPGMSVPFVTSANAPAIVTVSIASPNASRSFPGCGSFMRVAVDGNALPEEVTVYFTTWDSSSFVFVTPSISSGSHTVTTQWKQNSFLGAACAQVRSMVVLHQ